MNWDQIAGRWKQWTGAAKERWGKLTDNDLTTIAGQRDQLAGLLQERYGYERYEVEMSLDEFAWEVDTVSLPGSLKEHSTGFRPAPQSAGAAGSQSLT